MQRRALFHAILGVHFRSASNQGAHHISASGDLALIAHAVERSVLASVRGVGVRAKAKKQLHHGQTALGRRPVQQRAAGVVQRLRHAGDRAGYRVLGPAPAPLGRLRGEYRAQLLVKGANRKQMREALLAAVAERRDLPRRTTIDVDPLSVL